MWYVLNTGTPMNKEKLAKHRNLNGDHFQETEFGRVRISCQFSALFLFELFYKL